MKNLDKAFVIAGVISFLCLVGVSSCDSSEASSDSPSGVVVSSRLLDGKWKVRQYFDDHDETHLFYGYSFEFAMDGSVVATNLNSSVAGNWNVDDQQKDRVNVQMKFLLTEPFDELNSEWRVVESSSDEIVLEKFSGSARQADRLTLERV